ncbi:unnamed protein product [Echinostoma caproni]|uniref:Uncharacterized protein n=1 Tax=Echinostoma caproni TaxID=27848 RepID=A0A3P8GSA8_9TREM|nr:unnamed protein product [Echinostoma caproni]
MVELALGGLSNLVAASSSARARIATAQELAFVVACLAAPHPNIVVHALTILIHDSQDLLRDALRQKQSSDVAFHLDKPPSLSPSSSITPDRGQSSAPLSAYSFFQVNDGSCDPHNILPAPKSQPTITVINSTQERQDSAGTPRPYSSPHHSKSPSPESSYTDAGRITVSLSPAGSTSALVPSHSSWTQPAFLPIVAGLSKARLSGLVVSTAMVGCALAASTTLATPAFLLHPYSTLLCLAMGTGLTSAAANTINQVRPPSLSLVKTVSNRLWIYHSERSDVYRIRRTVVIHSEPRRRS